jgi:hypothetical protein
MSILSGNPAKKTIFNPIKNSGVPRDLGEKY